MIAEAARQAQASAQPTPNKTDTTRRQANLQQLQPTPPVSPDLNEVREKTKQAEQIPEQPAAAAGTKAAQVSGVQVVAAQVAAAQVAAAQVAAAQVAAERPLRSTPFGETDVRKAIEAFLARHPDYSPLKIEALRLPLEVLPDDTIRYTADSELLAGHLYEARIQATPFLRDQLANDFVQIEVRVQQAAIQKKAYTSKEKFEQFAEMYPVLNELKRQFDLDV